MYYMEDEIFARRLQDENQAYENFKRQKEEKEKENLNPVDSALEYIDPTPSIHDLFVKFDKKFFWGKLGMVEVAWSNKMTRCAGVCSFHSRAGLCKIALSAPLLSLRPRKDLVETLLHEMIHAYLFVTRNFKDRSDHGPEFHKHMFRINKEAGTKITVYHSFNDEVDYYQRHVWRCDGPCQKKKPYFGFLRRAVNRAPGPTDPWWNQHKAECGGTFIKISEPEKPVKKSKKVVVVKPGDKNKDIRDYFKHKTSGNQSNIHTLADIKDKPVTGMKTNSGTGTIVVTNVKKGNKAVSKVSNPNKTDSPVKNTAKGKIKKVGSGFSQADNSKQSSNDRDVRETVRNVWANKYKTTKPDNNSSSKKAKLESPVGDEGLLEGEIQNHVDEGIENCDTSNTSSDVGSSSCDETNEYRNCPVCSERILQLEMNDHLESCLQCTFVNDQWGTEDEVTCESVPCPCCYKWFHESEMNSHIDECLTLSTLKEEILIQ